MTEKSSLTGTTTPPLPPVVAPVLSHAGRSLLKATHVPLETPAPALGGALVKRAYAIRLNLQPGEVEQVERSYPGAPKELTAFEGRVPADRALLRDVPVDALLGFGEELARVREGTETVKEKTLLQRAVGANAALAAYVQPIG